MHIDQGNADIIDTIQISKVQELTKLKRYPIVNTVECELNLVKIIKSVDWKRKNLKIHLEALEHYPIIVSI